MNTTFASTTPSVADRIAELFAGIGREFSAYRIRRAQRLALASLLELDAARLDDLGISYQDVAEAVITRNL